MSHDLKNSASPTSPERLQIDDQNEIIGKVEQEKKRYINLFFCKLSIGIIFTYIFIICSITINIVNRVIFWRYKFKFNATLIFLQQLFCMIFFTIVSKQSKLFNSKSSKKKFFILFLKIKE